MFLDSKERTSIDGGVPNTPNQRNVQYVALHVNPFVPKVAKDVNRGKSLCEGPKVVPLTKPVVTEARDKSHDRRCGV